MIDNFKQESAVKTVPTIETTNTISLCGLAAIKIACNIPAESDEKGAGGFVGFSRGARRNSGLGAGLETPVYSEEYGQEQIYNRLRELTE